MSQLNERVILSDKPDRIKKDRAIADFKLPSQYLTGGNKKIESSAILFANTDNIKTRYLLQLNILIFHAGIWNTRYQIIKSEVKI